MEWTFKKIDPVGMCECAYICEQASSFTKNTDTNRRPSELF